MIYEDRQKLENAYDQVLLKEGTEVPNMDIEQDPREGYPEKFNETNDDDNQNTDQDSFKSAVEEIYQLLQGFVSDKKLYRIIDLVKDVSNTSVAKGKH